MNFHDLKTLVEGRDIVICGSGPSLKKINADALGDNVVYFALNNAFLYDKLPFSVMFSVDKTAIEMSKDKIEKATDLIKIFGKAMLSPERILDESYFSMENVIPFDVADAIENSSFEGNFVIDIKENAIRYFQSVATVAVQIALWLHPRRLYLVGLDFSTVGHYNDEIYTNNIAQQHKNWVTEHWQTDYVRNFWQKVRDFASHYYQDVKIVSINPVSLKGIFEDIYTDSLIGLEDIQGNITAVIPCKAHSSRLKNKNILPFADSNLLVHKIRQIKNTKGVSEIIVSSDSDEMLKMAENEGVKALKRPSKYADESRPFYEFMRYICNFIGEKHLLWAQCTSPMVDEKLFEKAISVYASKLGRGYDSLLSVHKFKHYLLDQKGPLNFKAGIQHVNSQDLPSLYSLTAGIFIAPTKDVHEWGYQYGPDAYYLEISQEEAIDIDTVWDYISACSFWEAKKKES